MKNIKRKISYVLSSLMMLGTPSLNYVNVQAMDGGGQQEYSLGGVFAKAYGHLTHENYTTFTGKFDKEDAPNQKQATILNLITYAVAREDETKRTSKFKALIKHVQDTLTTNKCFWLSNGLLVCLTPNGDLDVLTVEKLFPGLLPKGDAECIYVINNIGFTSKCSALTLPAYVKNNQDAVKLANKMGIYKKPYQECVPKTLSFPLLNVFNNEDLRLDSKGKLFIKKDGTKKYLTLSSNPNDPTAEWVLGPSSQNTYGLSQNLMGKLGINIPKNPPLDPNKQPPLDPNKQPPLDPNKQPPKKYTPPPSPTKTPGNPEPSFFSKHKKELIGGGIGLATVLVGGYGYYRYSESQLEKRLRQGPKKRTN